MFEQDDINKHSNEANEVILLAWRHYSFRFR